MPDIEARASPMHDLTDIGSDRGEQKVPLSEIDPGAAPDDTP